jgi:hypothetical protein
MERSFGVELVMGLLEKIEIFVRFFICIACIIMLCSQLLLTQASARKVLTYVDLIEGQQILEEQYRVARIPFKISEKSVAVPAGQDNVSDTRLLLISVDEQLPSNQIVIYINENIATSLINGAAALQVKDGDLVAIDGSVGSKVLKFTIEIPHSDIEVPSSGCVFEYRGSRISLGPIRFKH